MSESKDSSKDTKKIINPPFLAQQDSEFDPLDEEDVDIGEEIVAMRGVLVQYICIVYVLYMP